MFKFNKKKKVENSSVDSSGSDVASVKNDVTLIILTDRDISGMYDFYKSKGINIYAIYNDIEDARISLLMQSGACRIVIVESGLGIFNTTKMRGEIQDLLGMCDGISKFATIFYTDSTLKVDSNKEEVGIISSLLGRNKIKSDGSISWEYYNGTMGIINKLKEYKEIYSELVDDMMIDTTKSIDEALSYKGECTDVKLNNYDNIESDKLLDLVRCDSNPENSIQTYEIVV